METNQSLFIAGVQVLNQVSVCVYGKRFVKMCF